MTDRALTRAEADRLHTLDHLGRFPTPDEFVERESLWTRGMIYGRDGTATEQKLDDRRGQSWTTRLWAFVTSRFR